MISYSREEMERELVSDQALWHRVPATVAALLWPLEIVLLGWGVGWWVGAATVVVLGVASVAVPPRLRVSIYLVDLLGRLVGLPLRLCWLLVVGHLWLREPLFPILGQPLVGALVATIPVLLLPRPLAFLGRFAAQRALPKERR